MSSLLLLERKPRLLRVNFDTHFIFTHTLTLSSPEAHPVSTIQHSKSSLQHQLVSTKEIYFTYKSLMQSLFIHVAPIRFPNASSSMIQKLQTLQKSGLPVQFPKSLPATIRRLPSHKFTPIYPRKPKRFLFKITFPHYVPNISPEPFNLETLPEMQSPPPQVSET